MPSNTYPWHTTPRSPGSSVVAVPTVSELLQKAAELFPGVSLDRIRVEANHCCPNGEAGCERIYIELRKLNEGE